MSAAAYSIGHGAKRRPEDDGIILALLIAAGHLPKGADVPLGVVLAAHTAIAAGTLSGGWRIVKTMGSKITRLQPVGGFAAEKRGPPPRSSSCRPPAFRCPPPTHTITG